MGMSVRVFSLRMKFWLRALDWRARILKVLLRPPEVPPSFAVERKAVRPPPDSAVPPPPPPAPVDSPRGGGSGLPHAQDAVPPRRLPPVQESISRSLRN